MSLSEQQLFLIEFLVDNVTIPTVKAVTDEIVSVMTCVSFQILSLPPINIYRKTVKNCACRDEKQIFNTGKSCLFALPSRVLEKPVASFPISISVYKKLPDGVLPDVMLIGGAKIEARRLVNELLKKKAFKAADRTTENNKTDLCETCKETIKISTPTGQLVGDVTVFIRVSCFGRKIVTQFQIPHNRKPFLFKGTDESPVFQCERIPSRANSTEMVRCACAREIEGSNGSGESARSMRPFSSPHYSTVPQNRQYSNSQRLPPCHGGPIDSNMFTNIEPMAKNNCGCPKNR